MFCSFAGFQFYIVIMLLPALTVLVVLSCVAGARNKDCPDFCFCSNSAVMCKNAELTAIPTGFPADTAHLDLSNNLISEVRTEQFAGLTKLQSIRLSNNRVFYIRPHAFRGLPELKEILIQENPLEVLNAHAFSDLHSVDMIDLSFNKINAIKQYAFASSSGINQLNLNFNPLRIIETRAFSNLSNVRTLSIAKTELTEVQSDAFNGLSHVQNLIITSKMSNIPKHAFRGLQNVRTLQVTCADNATIDTLAFDGADSIEYVELYGVVKVERFAFYGMTNVGNLNLNDDVEMLDFASLVGLAGELERLDLGESRFNCNCYWQWVNKYDSTMLSREHLQKIVCKAPPKYNGLSVTDVNFEEMDCLPIALPNLPDKEEMEAEAEATRDMKDKNDDDSGAASVIVSSCAVLGAISVFLSLAI